ncbi:MAG TPA: cell division protein ZapA [Pseudolabrys sp.]|nr:cell division protein ZapA [Pseudolabrys sp.]
MAQVSVTINGRQFRIACDDGQEDNLADLALEIDQRIEGMRSSFGEIGDTRLTVMAAIQIADELREAQLRIRRLEEERTALQDARLVSAERAKQAQAAVINAFNSASERIEGITRKLNKSLGEESAPFG